MGMREREGCTCEAMRCLFMEVCLVCVCLRCVGVCGLGLGWGLVMLSDHV